MEEEKIVINLPTVSEKMNGEAEIWKGVNFVEEGNEVKVEKEGEEKVVSNKSIMDNRAMYVLYDDITFFRLRNSYFVFILLSLSVLLLYIPSLSHNKTYFFNTCHLEYQQIHKWIIILILVKTFKITEEIQTMKI
jgi:hypothetical protein